MRIYKTLLLFMVISSWFMVRPVFATTVPCTASCPDLSPGTTSGDWPMAGANLQRTSWNTEAVGASIVNTSSRLNIQWSHTIDPFIDNKVQLVAANNMIFLSGSKGIYAFKYDDGTKVWEYGLAIPPGNSPTYANGNLYIPGYDHRIHAISATTGLDLAGFTQFQPEPEAGFETNPLVVQDAFTANQPVIFAASNDGNLYSINATTGALNWKYQTNGAIRFSPAYKNGVIYFASEDSSAYAVNVNGTLKWKSAKLPGSGFNNYWPVIYHDKASNTDFAIFSASKKAAYSWWGNNNDWQAENWDAANNGLWSSCAATTAATGLPWATSQTTLDCDPGGNGLFHYFNTTRPDRRNLFIFGLNSGIEHTPYAPVNRSAAAQGGQRHPPLIIPEIQGGTNTSAVPYLHVGYSVGGNGGCGGWITGWKFDSQYLEQTWNDRGACDEPTAFTSGGNMIYWGEAVNHEAWGGVDVNKPQGSNFLNWSVPVSQNKYFGNFGILTWRFGNHNGVYSLYDGVTNMSPVPYKDHLYLVVGNILYSLSTASSPLLTDKGLISAPSSIPLVSVALSYGQVQQKLATEVQKIISAGHLRPGFYSSGYMDRFINNNYANNGYPKNAIVAGDALGSYFHTPGDTFLTLSQALPYITDTTLKNNVIIFMKAEEGNSTTDCDNLTRIATSGYPVECIANIGFLNGGQRESYIETPEMTTLVNRKDSQGRFINDNNSAVASIPRNNIWYPNPCCSTQVDIGDYPADAPYAAWKYAVAVGLTQAQALTLFNNIKPQLQVAGSNGTDGTYPVYGTNNGNDMTDANFLLWPYILNQYIAGYRGYLELEKMAGLISNINQDTTPINNGTCAVDNNAPRTTAWQEYTCLVDMRVKQFSKDENFNTDSLTTVEYNGNHAFNVARNFMFMTPELADSLRTSDLTQVQAALNEYYTLEPFWFVPKYQRTLTEGIGHHLYDRWAVFQAKAYILKEPFSELVKYLDEPAFERGDLYYIQNLVATLQAQTGPTPTPGPATPTATNTPIPSATPTPSVILGNGDANGSGSVDGNDIKALLANWFTSVNPFTSILNQYNDNNGLINSFDFAVVYNHMPAPTGTPSGNVFYISPTGNDNNSGTSTATPLATFTKAWTKLTPGDTLYLMDGTYTQVMQPNINGTPGKYITVKALNDGKAIIDGQNGTHQTVVLGTIWDNVPGYTRDTINPVGNWFDIEGIVAKNSSKDVYEVYSRNVILRRNSGYNANPHDNYHVFTVWSLGTPTNPANILLEDNVAAGSGRKMILAYDTYVNVVFRRNFAAWQWWLGDTWCTSSGGLPYWPQSDGIEIYPKAYDNQPTVSNNTFVENNILFGLTPDYGFSQNPNPGNSIGNNYFGDIALGSGMLWDNNQAKFVLPSWTVSTDRSTCSYNGISKPAACNNTQCIGLENGIYRSGFDFESSCSQKDYITSNNIIQDFFSSQNANKGLATTSCGWGNGASNNTLVRATLINNLQSDVNQADLGLFTSVSDTKIGDPSYTGGGAKLQYQYVNGSLTSTKLWPWPMENRIKTEFADPSLFQANKNGTFVQWNNFSVTQNVCQNILLPNGAVSACQ